ncbi:hypothetical protein ANAEL_05670 [Anaerolineales bacterium]|nr:hypothetical protein ANAEL_05670 [Anaerolineales bacterium]
MKVVLPYQATQHSVHPTGGSRRVFKQFAWLQVSSVKVAFSRPTHPRVTQAVGCGQRNRINYLKLWLKVCLKEHAAQVS